MEVCMLSARNRLVLVSFHLLPEGELSMHTRQKLLEDDLRSSQVIQDTDVHKRTHLLAPACLRGYMQNAKGKPGCH